MFQLANRLSTIANRLSPISYPPLPIAYHQTPISNPPSPFTLRLSPITHRLSPIAYRPSPIAFKLVTLDELCLNIFLEGGLSEGGGAYTRGDAYKIIVDIKKTLLKDLVYFRRNFFMSIKLIVSQSMNFCGNFCGNLCEFLGQF